MELPEEDEEAEQNVDSKDVDMEALDPIIAPEDLGKWVTSLGHKSITAAEDQSVVKGESLVDTCFVLNLRQFGSQLCCGEPYSKV
jgi:hypothetical protein